MKWLPVLALLGAAGLAQAQLATPGPTQRKEPTWEPTLTAQDAPTIKPWEDGATIAINSTNGVTTTLADAVLRFDRISDTATATGFKRQVWGPSAYLHRNTDTANPVNDRGVSFSYSGLWFDQEAEKARNSYGWSVDAKAGKKLTSETVDNKKVWFDKDSTRLTAGGQYVHVPSVGNIDMSNPGHAFYSVWTIGALAYLDRVSGGSGPSGRITGAQATVRADIAPRGLAPTPSGSGLGYVPSFAAWAQYQSDFSASGGRKKDNRPLYGIKAQLTFSQLGLDDSAPVPGLSLERTIGSDVLTGRAKSGVTKLALSLKY